MYEVSRETFSYEFGERIEDVLWREVKWRREVIDFAGDAGLSVLLENTDGLKKMLNHTLERFPDVFDLPELQNFDDTKGEEKQRAYAEAAAHIFFSRTPYLSAAGLEELPNLVGTALVSLARP